MSSIIVSELTDEGLLSWAEEFKELEEKGELINGCFAGIICRDSVDKEIRKRGLKSNNIILPIALVVGFFIYAFKKR